MLINTMTPHTTPHTPQIKIAVVTGASSGIGERLSMDLIAKGHPVVMLARHEDKMKRIIEKHGFTEAQAVAVSCDVSKFDQFQHAVRTGLEHFGRIHESNCILDLFVNNAGVMPLSSVDKMSVDVYTKMVQVNVLGVMNGIKIASQILIPNKCGTIVNVSSLAGRKPLPMLAYYNGTKYAVHGMSEAARHELRPHNIRVCIVAPGVVDTNLLADSNDSESVKSVEAYEKWIEQCGGKMLQPEDISNAILHMYTVPQRVCIREMVIVAQSQDDL